MCDICNFSGTFSGEKFRQTRDRDLEDFCFVFVRPSVDSINTAGWFYLGMG